MAVQGLHTLVLQVSNLDASLAYYEAVLGVRFTRQSERAVQAGIGPLTLLLHRDYEALPPQRGAGVHINFAVADASAHHAELSARGLAPSAIAVKPWGCQFSATDPDGYVLEFLGPRA
jgi:catechol 2,3-dioxygenase-like lactoylglutathione lyase family enzyme